MYKTITEKLAHTGNKKNSRLFQLLTDLFDKTMHNLPVSALLREANSTYTKRREAVVANFRSEPRAAQLGRPARAALAADLVVLEAGFNKQMLHLLTMYRDDLLSRKPAALAAPNCLSNRMPVRRRLTISQFLPAASLCDTLSQKYNISMGATNAQCIRDATKNQVKRRFGRQHQPVVDQAPVIPARYRRHSNRPAATQTISQHCQQSTATQNISHQIQQSAVTHAYSQHNQIHAANSQHNQIHAAYSQHNQMHAVGIQHNQIHAAYIQHNQIHDAYSQHNQMHAAYSQHNQIHAAYIQHNQIHAVYSQHNQVRSAHTHSLHSQSPSQLVVRGCPDFR